MPPSAPSETPAPLSPADLRWHCPPESLGFETTESVTPMRTIHSQETAVHALRFGLQTRAPGHHVFVRGLTGTGRITLVRAEFDRLAPPCDLVQDRCYVHNFDEAGRPRLITLPRGRGQVFQESMDELVAFLEKELAGALESAPVMAKRQAIQNDGRVEFEKLTKPFEERVRAQGAALVRINDGPLAGLAVLPVHEGKPIQPEELQSLVLQEKISEKDADAIRERLRALNGELEALMPKLATVEEANSEAIREAMRDEIERLCEPIATRIRGRFKQESIDAFIEAIIDDVKHYGPPMGESAEMQSARYQVNLLSSRDADRTCPIVVESAPGYVSLFGAIEQSGTEAGPGPVDHHAIRAGSLLSADGGYLVMEARDLFNEPGVWKLLMRTLRTGKLQLAPEESRSVFSKRGVVPEPIDINVKVVLVGDHDLHQLLEASDPDFPHLFKVTADFESVVRRDEAGLKLYAGVISRIADEESLPPFTNDAVAKLAEHGARIAARADRMSARMGRLCDIAREAAFIGTQTDAARIDATLIERAITRSRERTNLPARRYREYLNEGTICVQTSGSVIGQINGLATMSAGPLTYGFPQRITANVGPGKLGLINIEEEAALSGSIHTKGISILRGLLQHLLRPTHPLSFDASIAFEQSYGGVDGDSASGAETVCLISALTRIPIRQDLAMTGAIDQHGRIMAIGAVNEKIEGFFYACRSRGLTGSQGCIIPRSNAGDLMLRDDVLHACKEGNFAVYAVEYVTEALTLFTGEPAGGWHGDVPPAADTVLGRAIASVERLYQTSNTPANGVIRQTLA